MEYFEAFLMVEFDCKTNLPVSIACYSENEDEITMIGNEYVQIASLKFEVQTPNADFDGLEFLCNTLEDQLHKGVYNACRLEYKTKAWTVEQCVHTIIHQARVPRLDMNYCANDDCSERLDACDMIYCLKCRPVCQRQYIRIKDTNKFEVSNEILPIVDNGKIEHKWREVRYFEGAVGNDCYTILQNAICHGTCCGCESLNMQFLCHAHPCEKHIAERVRYHLGSMNIDKVRAGCYDSDTHDLSDYDDGNDSDTHSLSDCDNGA